MTSNDYMNQAVVYGGLLVTRGAMIADLARIAEASGHPNPQALVSRYMQGFER
jgi:hypothetical protein